MSVLSDIAQEEHEMEMTPMIDVTFLLLIFFLCTLKFKTLEGKLTAYLPKDVGVNSSDAEPKEKVEITIKVVKEGEKRDWRPGKINQPWSGEGRYLYVGRELAYSIGPIKFRDLDALSARLKNIYKSDSERPATIDCRQKTVYGDMVPVLDAAVEAGYEDITFVGSYE